MASTALAVPSTRWRRRKDARPGEIVAAALACFAERGFAVARDWLAATRQAIADCECDTGCPSCVQSPKCGSGNEPLSKDGALLLLDRLLTPRGGRGKK